MNNSNSYEKNENTNLFDSSEAIKVGTIFKTLYKPYKGYTKVTLKGLNERQKLMLKIQEYKLACHDLSLYLDIYPNDEQAIMVREKYHKKLKETEEIYNKKYSPFSLNAMEINENPFPWSSKPFPWGDK